MEFERLYAIGKDLRMTGAELKRWVDAEIARERDQPAESAGRARPPEVGGRRTRAQAQDRAPGKDWQYTRRGD
ncbi:hypothetical protein HPB52_003217 [Rhipicephalus sanguineus]|uniref:Uncharacterized protein n=1 Tax=Rhipicephalus sanguineus TaxID=34632 RepID=A0A9D4Q8V9_RHISA|nr:hypothetical protein HPB52_003217 [Rhipicephalus sanguineus]